MIPQDNTNISKKTMKLTSLLLGDFADLFQDNRMDEAQNSLRVASSAASQNRLQLSRLAQTVEQRISEIERENAVLSLLIVRLLKHLSQVQPDEAQKIVDEVSTVLSSGTPAAPKVLHQILDLPQPSRTPISDYLKPIPVRPMPPQSRPRPIPKKKP